MKYEWHDTDEGKWYLALVAILFLFGAVFL